ncbi:MAG: hypothetical protein HFH60_03810 [Lachnospiraceae bacterium]|nr:hypothetical protein [Lachnospiraceae bacterium]
MNNIELYREGFTITEITRKNNLSDMEVQNFIKEISTSDLKIHKIKIRNRIIEMNDEGYTINAINKKTSVSISIIKDILGK